MLLLRRIIARGWRQPQHRFPRTGGDRPCWRRNPWTGRLLGLDYPALWAAAAWMGLERSPDLWERVQWQESEMLQSLPKEGQTQSHMY